MSDLPYASRAARRLVETGSGPGVHRRAWTDVRRHVTHELTLDSWRVWVFEDRSALVIEWSGRRIMPWEGGPVEDVSLHGVIAWALSVPNSYVREHIMVRLPGFLAPLDKAISADPECSE